MTQTLHFSVSGEIITSIAREKLYINHDLKGALDTAMAGLQTDQLSQNEIRMLALQILNGDADIVGTYPGDDYGVEFRNDVDSKNCDMSNILNEFTKIYDELTQLEEENKDLIRRFLFLCDHGDFSEVTLRMLSADYYNEHSEELFPGIKLPDYLKHYDDEDDNSSSNTMLDSFLAQKRREIEEDTSDDYGWLEPDGTYHPVEWGRHSEWASDYCENHWPFREYSKDYIVTDDNGNRQIFANGDFLMYVKHWVLIDSPYQGLAYHHYDPKFGLTKDQKEFLYDYYIARNRNKDANALYEND